MITPNLNDRLFENEELKVFAVLDGASIPDLRFALYEHQPEHVCLYRGELEPDLAEIAPYLVRLEREADFTGWLLDEGWGRHWGIFALSPESLEVMRNHFRQFLIVYGPENEPLYFRYYDPRILRLYLPTCQADELAALFGPVASYLLEAEDPKLADRCRLESGALVWETVEINRETREIR